MGMGTEKIEEAASSIKVYMRSDIHKRRKIGEGAEGCLYEAELKPEGRTVAIKEIVDTNSNGKIETFGYEARMMARLHHPNIVQFYGVAADTITDISDGRCLQDIIMEFMPHGDLEDILTEDQNFELLPWRSRVSIALQVAQAVEYMHSLGVVHLDIKFSNVLLDLTDPARPVSKIGDFGAATHKEDGLNNLTGIGTAGRSAPEIVIHNFREITEKADVYSFGVLMSELLTSRIYHFADVIFNNNDLRMMFFGGTERHNKIPDWSFHQWRKLMRECMTCIAPMRPSFAEVTDRLRDMLATLHLDAEDVDSIAIIKASAISDDDSFWKLVSVREIEEEYDQEHDDLKISSNRNKYLFYLLKLRPFKAQNGMNQETIPETPKPSTQTEVQGEMTRIIEIPKPSTQMEAESEMTREAVSETPKLSTQKKRKRYQRHRNWKQHHCSHIKI